MRNITVDDLFPKNRTKRGRLDTETLFRGTFNLTSIKEDLSHDELLETVMNGRKKKLKIMINYYNRCCKLIKDNINDGNDCMTFTIPQFIPDCTTYSSHETLEYITNNLRKKMIDTLILDECKIFISWDYLELKLEDK
ncbi:hypothetical protein HOK00_07795 [bacterium]|jgi:hypothetical protein|nr:hypothetical protein [bacterium]